MVKSRGAERAGGGGVKYAIFVLWILFALLLDIQMSLLYNTDIIIQAQRLYNHCWSTSQLSFKVGYVKITVTPLLI